MGHYFIAVLFTPQEVEKAQASDMPTAYIMELLRERLKPFDDNRDVEPVKEYLDDTTIQRMSDAYHTNNLYNLARKMSAWCGYRGGLDENGKLYRWNHSNPLGKWDYYVVGGRYSGAIKNTVAKSTLGANFNRNSELETILENSTWVKMLPSDFGCFGILTPDEGWLDRDDMPEEILLTERLKQNWKMPDLEYEKLKAAANEAWDKRYKQVLQAYSECFVVGVDCHL